MYYRSPTEEFTDAELEDNDILAFTPANFLLLKRALASSRSDLDGAGRTVLLCHFPESIKHMHEPKFNPFRNRWAFC
jgi:hypothetical protein